MSLAAIEAVLAEEAGLSAGAVGPHAIELAVSARRAATASSEDAYLFRLGVDAAERQALIEELVVPETWFFRNLESFRHLQHWVRTAWLPAHRQRALRVLSLPCSTGEEAYSLAMALADLGLPPERVTIDAVDISERALAQSRRGVYRRHSFRGEELDFRERHFVARGAELELTAPIRDSVRFLPGNVLDPTLLAGQPRYDVVFCRNLLIYLNANARRRAGDTLDRLLARGGRLYLGHADAFEKSERRFRATPDAGVFAYERSDDARPLPSARPTPVSRPIVVSPPPAPSDPQGLARQLADAGRLSDAAAVCERDLRERGPEPGGYCLLGVIRMAQQRLDEAEGFLNRALYLDRHHYESLVHLAALHARRGDETGAANLRRRAERATAEGAPKVGG